MAAQSCPKCRHELDEGRVNVTSNEFITYVSAKQTGIMRQGTRIESARACPNCGYVEMYLNPAELQKRLAKP